MAERLWLQGMPLVAFGLALTRHDDAIVELGLVVAGFLVAASCPGLYRGAVRSLPGWLAASGIVGVATMLGLGLGLGIPEGQPQVAALVMGPFGFAGVVAMLWPEDKPGTRRRARAFHTPATTP